MNGYNLRRILSNDMDLIEILQKKIAKLNLEAEPFVSVADML